MSSGAPFLSVEGVTVRFGGLMAVNRLTMAVDMGEVVGLIGPNGAGKTTSFNAIAGLIPVTEGRVMINGRDLTRASVSARARAGIARTFQKSELFGSMTVEENLLYATEAPALGERPFRLLMFERFRDRTRVDELLAFTGLEDLRDERAADLPLGLSRVVELARALCSSPSLLMLDEPSSGLDAAETEVLGDLLEKAVVQLRVGVLVIEHDMSLVMRTCSRLFVLEEGCIIAAGPVEDVAADPIVHRAYLGSTTGAS